MISSTWDRSSAAIASWNIRLPFGCVSSHLGLRSGKRLELPATGTISFIGLVALRLELPESSQDRDDDGGVGCVGQDPEQTLKIEHVEVFADERVLLESSGQHLVEALHRDAVLDPVVHLAGGERRPRQARLLAQL